MMLTLPMKKPAMIMVLLNRPTFKSIRLKIRICYYLNIPAIYTKNNHLCTFTQHLNDFLSSQLSYSYQITLFNYILQREFHIFNSFKEKKLKLLPFGIKRLQRKSLFVKLRAILTIKDWSVQKSFSLVENHATQSSKRI